MKDEYIPLENPTKMATHLQLSVSYYKDMRTRGYYLWVTPVEIYKDGGVGMLVTQSKWKLILPVTRKSDKAYAQAVALCTPEFKQALIDAVLKEYGGQS